MLQNSFEKARDASITPDIERMAIVQGANNNNIESSLDLLSNNKREMSLDSNTSNIMLAQLPQ